MGGLSGWRTGAASACGGVGGASWVRVLCVCTGGISGSGGGMDGSSGISGVMSGGMKGRLSGVLSGGMSGSGWVHCVCLRASVGGIAGIAEIGGMGGVGRISGMGWGHLC
jgi:hypothetical protein